MLKTNSKKARENIKKYIIDNFTPEGYTNAPPESWPEIARFIMEAFKAEKYSTPGEIRYYNGNIYAAFADWCAGLPSIIDTCYFYNRSAVKDLAGILEESDAERAKYSESDAERVLTYLIYRELTRGGRVNEIA